MAMTRTASSAGIANGTLAPPMSSSRARSMTTAAAASVHARNAPASPAPPPDGA